MEAYLFVVFVFVMVGETALTIAWSPAFFRFGVVIFRRTYQVSRPSTVPRAEDLASRIPQSAYPTLLFRDFGGHRYGFREKLFEFGKLGYSTVMRGVISFDPHRQEVTVRGYLNWFTPVFLLVATSFLINVAAPTIVALVFLGAAAAIIGWVYTVQSRRFAEVADIAAREWESPSR